MAESPVLGVHPSACASPAENTLKLQTGERERQAPLMRFAHRLHSEDGAAVIPFILALLFFIPIVAIVVQYALLVSAYNMVGSAADAAARSAIVNLPEGNPDAIRRAADMVLAPVSPRASIIDPEGQAIADAYTDTGLDPGSTFASRYSYAKQAANITWDNRDFTALPSSTAWVQVDYSFKLTVPYAWVVLAPNQTTVSGITGHFTNLSRRVQFLTSPSRKTGASDVNGPTLQP